MTQVEGDIGKTERADTILDDLIDSYKKTVSEDLLAKQYAGVSNMHDPLINEPGANKKAYF